MRRSVESSLARKGVDPSRALPAGQPASIHSLRPVPIPQGQTPPPPPSRPWSTGSTGPANRPAAGRPTVSDGGTNGTHGGGAGGDELPSRPPCPGHGNMSEDYKRRVQIQWPHPCRLLDQSESTSPTSSGIHAAGEREFRAFNGFRCRLICCPPTSYRFFSVMLMPKLSIIMNDVSRSGFVVMAFIYSGSGIRPCMSCPKMSPPGRTRGSSCSR